MLCLSNAIFRTCIGSLRRDRSDAMEKSTKLNVKSKIWIEDGEGKVIFGLGRLNILLAVQEHGSILSAAKTLNMSYRAVWGKIKATEDRLGAQLVARKVGGARGGGSELTPLGKALVERYQRLRLLTEDAADSLFRDIFEGRTL